MGKIMYKDRQYSSSFDKSVNILYDNSNSGLNASNVQAAIDELKSMPVASHTHNYAASSSAGGDAKKAEVLSAFYLDSSQQATSGYWNPYTYGVGTWGAVAGTYTIYDSEGTGFNGIFNIKVRCGADGAALDGSLNWMTANSTTPPVLTITHSYDSAQKKTIFRLYITVPGGWRSFKLTRISEVGGSNVSYSSSIVTSMTGTTFLTASSIANAGNVSAHNHDDAYLKLTGGTISGTSDTPLYLKSNATSSYIGFKNSSGTNLGYFGVGSDLKPYFYDTAYRTILHSGNWSSYCAPASHNHSGVYLPLGGGTVSGTVTMPALELNNSTPFIDFHYGGSTADYTSRIAEFSSGTLTVTGNLGVNGNLVSTKTFAALSSSDPQGTYYTANRIHSTTNSIFRISNTGNTEGVAIGENFRSSQNNTMNLGNSSYKWKQLYAGTTTINTSDRNSKEDFRTFDSNENYEKLFMDLKPLIFKFKDGDSRRDHFGFVSQDVEESLYKLGFNDKSFAGFCKDVLMHEVETEDGDTKEVPKLDENGNEQYIYGLRYGEFTAFNTWMIQKIIKENQELKDKNEKLEAKSEELESRLQAIENMLEKLNV